jgi:ABC-type dipeptide/oligopeptide/nickel transport system ATPase component
MTGGAELIIGATGTGKTTKIKHYLSLIPNKKAIQIYDINNEYKEFYNKPLEDFEVFIDRQTRTKKAVMVFEEATIFLSNRTCNRQLVDLLVRKRHTGNYIFLCFHSLRSLPKYVLDLCNYITIFHTNDSIGFVESTFKNDKLTEGFLQVQRSPNKHYYRFIKLY